MISERTLAKSFSSFWEELLPLLTPRFVVLFNEAYEKVLLDDDGVPLRPIPLGSGVRADIVAEFSFRGAQLLHEESLQAGAMLQHPLLMQQAGRTAFDVIDKYEGRRPTHTSDLSAAEIVEGACLARQYEALYRAFGAAQRIEFCPTFLGAGFLNAAEGDLAVGDTLIEVKTTTRRVGSKDLRQLLTYLALDASAGRTRWFHIGVFNPRRGTFHRAEVDALVLRLSGGKPRSDVFAELLAYVETGAAVIDADF